MHCWFSEFPLSLLLQLCRKNSDNYSDDALHSDAAAKTRSHFEGSTFLDPPRGLGNRSPLNGLIRQLSATNISHDTFHNHTEMYNHKHTTLPKSCTDWGVVCHFAKTSALKRRSEVFSEHPLAITCTPRTYAAQNPKP